MMSLLVLLACLLLALSLQLSSPLPLLTRSLSAQALNAGIHAGPLASARYLIDGCDRPEAQSSNCKVYAFRVRV
jgi:hypothetical protein